MKIIRNTMPISDIYHKMKSGDLIINRSYQRSKGLWPNNARTYFIDTILNDFPFPKIVLRDIIDLKTKKTKREIIDGQQRLTTIRDFINNKYKLSKVSKNFKGMYFDDLDDIYQKSFLSYEVSVDLVISASEEEVLEIFRRINSYTLPLNTAEKRHATYQGEFKWFINDLTDLMTPFFEKFKVLTLREIARMMNADLITECSQIILDGIQNRSSHKLEALYKNNDENFNRKEEVNEKLTESFNFIKNNLSELFETFSIPSYQFYSIMGALIFNKYGIPDEKKDLNEYSPINLFSNLDDNVYQELNILFNEVDEKNENGKYKDYVKASISTTQSYKNRLTRIKTLISILQNND